MRQWITGETKKLLSKYANTVIKVPLISEFLHIYSTRFCLKEKGFQYTDISVKLTGSADHLNSAYLIDMFSSIEFAYTLNPPINIYFPNILLICSLNFHN